MKDRIAYLESRIEVLSSYLKESEEENRKLKSQLEDSNKEKEYLKGIVEKLNPVLETSAELLAPYISKMLFEDEEVINHISDIAYESAGKWADRNYVQCGYNPLEE